ncbi:hypothetical protein [Faecalicoccus pleomorphus]|uniref:hypothetical protein n=1 Tax=Faecalicoccus pleomorphus TaxID=1323 RepID=UPI0022E928C4|nr:hypothetical protein [Faecalicoccus pleomorphus]
MSEPNQKLSDAANFLQEATKAANYWTGYDNAREAWLTYLADQGYMFEPDLEIIEENPNLKKTWNDIQDAYFPYGLDDFSIDNQRHYTTKEDFCVHEWDNSFDDPQWLENNFDHEAIFDEAVNFTCDYTLVDGKVIQQGNHFYCWNPQADLSELMNKYSLESRDEDTLLTIKIGKNDIMIALANEGFSTSEENLNKALQTIDMEPIKDSLKVTISEMLRHYINITIPGLDHRDSREQGTPSLGDIAQESREAAEELGDNTQSPEHNVNR